MNFKYLLNEKPSSEDEIKECEDVVLINDVYERNTIHAFRTHDDFTEWSGSSRYNDKFAEVLKGMETEKENRNQPDEERQAELASEQKRVHDELNRLSKMLRLPLSSSDLLMEAIDKGILNSFIVWDKANYTGDWRWGGPPFLPCGDFRWLGFNDKPRSVLCWAFHVLCEDKCYGGRKFYMLGWARCNLSIVGFDRITSSSW